MKIKQKTRVDEPLGEVLSTLGAALRGHRLVKRLTQEQAADQAGFSRQTLARIERGDPSVAFGQIARYAQVVGAAQFLKLNPPRKANPAQRRVRHSRDERAKAAPAPNSSSETLAQ